VYSIFIVTLLGVLSLAVLTAAGEASFYYYRWYQDLRKTTGPDNKGSIIIPMIGAFAILTLATTLENSVFIARQLINEAFILQLLWVMQVSGGVELSLIGRSLLLAALVFLMKPVWNWYGNKKPKMKLWFFIRQGVLGVGYGIYLIFTQIVPKSF
jgi:hypothetical protein|tara:strand:+ start:572 stop:1036 length:465 start_codon:yes stop_codon:yes gene_type:complete